MIGISIQNLADFFSCAVYTLNIICRLYFIKNT